MKADTVGPWVNIYTDFGRYIEAPCVVLYFVDVEITGHLCIVGTQFQSDIRLADTVTKAIVSGKTEGNWNTECCWSVVSADELLIGNV